MFKKPEKQPESNPIDAIKLAAAMLSFATFFVSILNGRPPQRPL